MRIRKELVLRHIGNEHIIIDPNKGTVDMTKVYTLNESAAWLWEQLVDTNFSVGEIVELLSQRYNVDATQVLNDAHTLVNNFKEQGLLTDDYEAD